MPTIDPYTQELGGGGVQAPLSSATAQLQTAPTGGLFDPVNQAIIGHQQAIREQAVAEQARADRQAALAYGVQQDEQARADRQAALAYGVQQDALAQADREARLQLLKDKNNQTSLKYKAEIKKAELLAKQAEKKAAVMVRARRVLAKKAGISLEGWSDEEIAGTQQADFSSLIKGKTPARVAPIARTATESEVDQIDSYLKHLPQVQSDLADPTVSAGMATSLVNLIHKLQADSAQAGVTLSFEKARDDAIRQTGIAISPAQDTAGWNNIGANISFGAGK